MAPLSLPPTHLMIDALQLTAWYGLFLKIVLTALTFSLYFLLKEKNERLSKIPLYLGISSFLFVLADLPVIFMPQVEYVTPLLITHSLILLASSYLKFIASFQFPISLGLRITGNTPESVMKWKRWGGIVIVVFAIIVVLMNTLHGFMTPESSELVLRIIDLITSGVGAILFTGSFVWSWSSLVNQKGVRYFFSGLLLLNLCVYLFYLTSYFTQPQWMTFEVGWISSNIFNIMSFVLLMVFLAGHVGLVFENPEEQHIKTGEVVIQRILIQIDRSQVTLQITWVDQYQQERKESITKDKWMKPMMYVFAFAFARKVGIELSHNDMSAIKFRMLEYWNKNASIPFKMSDMYTGGRSSYGFKAEVVEIEIVGETEIWKVDGILSVLMEFKTLWTKELLRSDKLTSKSPGQWTHSEWQGFFNSYLNS